MTHDPRLDPDHVRIAALLDRLAATVPDRAAPLPDIVAGAHAARRRRRRRRRDAVVAVAALAVVLGGGLTLAGSLSGDAERSIDPISRTADELPCDRTSRVEPDEPVPSGPSHPTNAAGLTYGGHSDTRMPDLVATIGDCGRIGYTYRRDHDESAPWVPGAGGPVPRSIPVYESDGVTRIDTFTQSPGVSSSSPAGTTPPVSGPDATDLRGEWVATIAGVTGPRGRGQYDTFRDMALTMAFDGDEVTAYDGCESWSGGFHLEDGAFSVTRPFEPDPVIGAACPRSAPVTAILDNVRHVTEAGARVHLHLEDFRIVVVLSPAR